MKDELHQALYQEQISLYDEGLERRKREEQERRDREEREQREKEKGEETKSL